METEMSREQLIIALQTLHKILVSRRVNHDRRVTVLSDESLLFGQILMLSSTQTLQNLHGCLQFLRSSKRVLTEVR